MAEKKQTDIQTVAQLAGCSTEYIGKLIKAGKIPASTKGRQREITIPISDAVKIVREGQRKYQKKSRIIWYRFSEKMPNKEECAHVFVLKGGKYDLPEILTYPNALLIQEYIENGYVFWAYLTPEMFPMAR